MAKESKISQIPVTVEKLDAMMKELKKELFEVLLFVNNVKNISISAMNENGHLGKSYSVQVVMTPEDEKKRQEIAQYMREVGKQVKEKNVLPTNIEVKKCTYTMKIRDNLGMEEKWLVVQQVGFEKPIEKSIVDAFKTNQLGMLPRGVWLAFWTATNRGHNCKERRKLTAFSHFHLKLASQCISMVTLHWTTRPEDICGEMKLVAIAVTGIMRCCVMSLLPAISLFWMRCVDILSYLSRKILHLLILPTAKIPSCKG